MPTIEEIDAQIGQLVEQKKQLQQKAKDAALKKANDAIADLRAMGFNYRLVQSDEYAPRTRTASGRRSGIRDQVFGLVKANASGITAADTLTKLNASSDSDKTAVRNALAALKRGNKIQLVDGVYTPR